MNRNPKLMILTASYGDGHVQAARSLESRFQAEGIDEVRIIDLMREAHPFINKITTSLYMKSSKSSLLGLDYYGWSYYMTRDSKPDGTWGKCFNYVGKKKLRAIVEQERPNAIINTFPFGAAPEIGQLLGIPTFTVMTDYALHARWIHTGTRKYYVATKELKSELMNKGFAAHQIEVSGIPVRQAFYETGSRTGTFPERLSPSRKTVLISAGSYGVLSHIEKMIAAFMDREDCQLVVVCGRNQKLEQRLKLLYAEKPSVHILGFVENIHEWMAVSSCIVTKAGGLTITEALTLRLPIFIFKPFPGQEKENALFLAEKGAARISQSTDELAAQLQAFLSNETIGQDMKRCMSFQQRGIAAELIVKDILQTLELKSLVTLYQYGGMQKFLSRSVD
jgi:processive 1,2-diacylglycerol beta-glucosyltransferase